MIQTGFFDALESGGEYDRVYNAASFAHYFSLLVKNGVFANPATSLQVTASSTPNMQVRINPGSAWINGYYMTIPSGSSEVLTIAVASATLARIDSIVVGLDLINRQMSVYVKKGSSATTPTAPSLTRTSDLYEIELAQVSVGAGIGSIKQDYITDMRQNSTRCGIVAGTISQIDATNLFAQFTAEFNTWFQSVKDQLSGDIAANLQMQINDIKENFSPTGPIVLKNDVHYFSSRNKLPSNAVLGQIAFVKVQ